DHGPPAPGRSVLQPAMAAAAACDIPAISSATAGRSATRAIHEARGVSDGATGTPRLDAADSITAFPMSATLNCSQSDSRSPDAAARRWWYVTTAVVASSPLLASPPG